MCWHVVSNLVAPSVAVPACLALVTVASLPLFGLGGAVVEAYLRCRYGLDQLTGLPDRRYFMTAAARWLGRGEHRARRSSAAALLLIDLDRLRDVNGTLGHEHGDRMLATVGRRLRLAVRPTDLVARIDGDEFAVLMRGVGAVRAEETARRLREILRAPVQLDDMRVHAEVSIGIAHAPEHGRGVWELMRRAEEAMYAAKRTRSGQRVYGPDCRTVSRARLSLRADLRGALDEGQIELRYQPKADLRTGWISGVEALVRWRHPAYGLRPPDLFLPEMEHAGLMPLLTRRVLDLALADCARWHADGVPLTVSVNVSASVIMDRGFVETVRSALARHRLPASALVIEVTENGLITGLELAQRTLSGLRELGVRVSLDDYGTGFCSLAYLRELPADEVKLDRRFLQDIDRDSSAAAIVRSTVALAHALRLRIVAEGVETPRSWASLAAWQCDEVQGYFVSRPLAGERVLAWLREWGERFTRLSEAAEQLSPGAPAAAGAPAGALVGAGADPLGGPADRAAGPVRVPSARTAPAARRATQPRTALLLPGVSSS